MKKHLVVIGLVAFVLLSSCDSLFGPTSTDINEATTDFNSGMTEAQSGTKTYTGNAVTAVNAAKTVSVTVNFDTKTQPINGTVVFSGYKGAKYTITGTLKTVYSGGTTSDYTLTGDLSYTGGAVTKISFDETVKSSVASGTITINGTKYDASTGKKL